ncbi:MAG: hypothetical protein DRN04_14300 [Thermoprotei archaeon]|nr:MAG: hypothetical protein DRN04_14300 [Thermoprotei archaeon]
MEVSSPKLLVIRDTLFIGIRTKEPSEFSELCRAHDECVLYETGEVCPITKCAKGLLNGSCGGVRNGKCGVNPERECAWYLIYKRLKLKAM